MFTFPFRFVKVHQNFNIHSVQTNNFFFDMLLSFESKRIRTISTMIATYHHIFVCVQSYIH